MDVLKQKLNDIGSCIRYPFYFFEDGSFSHTFVCGKMNACLVVKGAFAESDKCFFASAEIASMSGIKAMEKSWAQKSDAPDNVNWFKKYLNDIGRAINYPFYIFEDGTYAKTSSLDDKQAVLYVKQPFTSVEGESTFFSSDVKRVLLFEEDLKKVQRRKIELQQIIFRMLAGEKVPDTDALQVIENEPHDLVKRCVHSVWKWKDCCYINIAKIYPKSFAALVKKNWWDIYCFDEQELKYFCLPGVVPKHFLSLVFQYATPEILEKILKLCLKGNFSYAIIKKYGIKWMEDPNMIDFSVEEMSCRRKSAAKCFHPLYLIERRDADAYRIYRKYLGRQYRMCKPGSGFREYKYYDGSYDLHFDEEFDAIVALGDREWFKILFDGISLSTEQKAKLIRTGNIEMIQTYIECCGIDGKFRELLLYSGNDELVELTDSPKQVLRKALQKEVENVAQGETDAIKSFGWLQKVKKFFGVTA